MTAVPRDPSRLPGLREWQQALLLSLRLGQAALVLVFICIVSITATLLPLRLADPGWYLSLGDLLIANAPIAITAGCLGCLSVLLAPPDSSRFYRAKIALQRISSIFSLLFFLLLPLELVAGLQMVASYNASYRASVDRLERSEQQIAARIRSGSRPSGLLPLPPGSAEAPASREPSMVEATDRQKELLLQLEGEQNRIRDGLQQQRQQKLLRLLINAIRVTVCALPIALFFRQLAKPSADLIAQFQRTSQ